MSDLFSGAERGDFEVVLPDGLILRWAKASYTASVQFVAALAYGVNETEEFQSDFALRRVEQQFRESHLGGSPENWAVCIDRSRDRPPLKPWRRREDKPLAVESEYAKRIRAEAVAAEERVVSVVCLQQDFAHFDGQVPGAPIGRIAVVATLEGYRKRSGIMKGLFEMVHAKSRARGDAFCAVNGIPAYYRNFGYEYTMRWIHEMKTSLHQPLPLSDSQYLLRPCTPEDAADLYRLHRAQLPNSQLFFTETAEENRVAYLAGVRRAPFDDAQRLDGLMVNPVSILEYQSRAVAAVIFGQTDSTLPTVGANRVYFDAEHPDLAQLARELISRVVAALNGFFDAQMPAEGYAQGADTLMPKPHEILWKMAPGSPLIQHFQDQKLARSVVEEDMLFSTARHQLFHLYSLKSALEAMRPALTARMKAAKRILGSAVTVDLGIAFYQTSREGAMLRIKDSEVIEVSEHSFQGAQLSAPCSVSAASKIQVVGPYAALVQLIFGFLSLQKLKEVYPDLQVAPGCRVLVEALFPVLRYDGHVYT